jgi:hypothetical protein
MKIPPSFFRTIFTDPQQCPRLLPWSSSKKTVDLRALIYWTIYCTLNILNVNNQTILGWYLFRQYFCTVSPFVWLISSELEFSPRFFFETPFRACSCRVLNYRIWKAWHVKSSWFSLEHVKSSWFSEGIWYQHFTSCSYGIRTKLKDMLWSLARVILSLLAKVQMCFFF